MFESHDPNEIKSLLRVTNSAISLFLLNHHPHTRFYINNNFTIETKNLTFSAFCDCVSTLCKSLGNSRDASYIYQKASNLYIYQQIQNLEAKFTRWFFDEITRIDFFNTCLASSQTKSELRPIITPVSSYFEHFCSLANFEQSQKLNSFEIFKKNFFNFFFKKLATHLLSLNSKEDFELMLYKIDAIFGGLLNQLVDTLTQNLSEIDPRSELKATHSLWGQLILPLTRFNANDFSYYYYTNLLHYCDYSADLDSATNHETLRIEMLSCAYDFFSALHLKNANKKKLTIDPSLSDFLHSTQCEINSTQQLLSSTQPSLPLGFWQKILAFISNRNYNKNTKDKYSRAKHLLIVDFFKTLQKDLSLTEQFVFLYFILGTSEKEKSIYLPSMPYTTKLAKGIHCASLSNDFLNSLVHPLLHKVSAHLSQLIKTQDINPSLTPFLELEILKKTTPNNYTFIEKKFKI